MKFNENLVKISDFIECSIVVIYYIVDKLHKITAIIK